MQEHMQSPPFRGSSMPEASEVWGKQDNKVRQLIARMRALAFLASLHRLIQSKDVLEQTQPEKGKVTEKTDFLLPMCQGTGSRLKPCRKAIERLDSCFDRAEIEPGAHYFNTQGSQTDRHPSHSGEVGRLMMWSQVTSQSYSSLSVLGRLPKDTHVISTYYKFLRLLRYV